MSAINHPAANCSTNARNSEIAAAIVAVIESEGDLPTSWALTRAGFNVDHPERDRARDVLHSLCEMGVLELKRWEKGRVYVGQL